MELPGIITSIARDERDNFVIDTVKVNGYYETAIKHRDYNNNHWIILKRCDNLEEAKKIHKAHVDIFSRPDFDYVYAYILDIYNDEYYKQED